MKKLTYLFLTATLGILTAAYTTITPVFAQDFTAYSLTTTPTIDGTINPTEWSDAGYYTSVPIDPTGTAEVWTKHDGTYLYMAIKFTADSNNPWVALQLGTTGCMDTDADGALFGHDTYSANGYQDIYFSGTGPINVDGTQDGTGAISVDTSNIVSIELKKPLNSGDTAGKDIAWSVGGTYDLVIAWDSNGGGSSGGSVSHRSSGPTPRTIFINANVISEFPGLMLIAVLIAVIIPVVIIIRKTVPKPTTTIKL